MASQAVAQAEQSSTLPKAGEDLFFIAMPMETYRAISDAAMQRGLTFAQSMQQAVNAWLGTQPVMPRLLVEQGKPTSEKKE